MPPPITKSTNPFEDDASPTPKPEEPTEETLRFETASSASSSSIHPEHPPECRTATLTISPTDLAPIEASWQYLGDLPYRRVPIYKNVTWSFHSASTTAFGLSQFPSSWLAGQRSAMLDEEDIRKLLTTSTVTKVAGCPYGGPIAAITLPLAPGTTPMRTSELRILSSSGKPLASVEFPPPNLGGMSGGRRVYTAADVLTIGFTDRWLLVVVLRDSSCLVYDLRGELILPPFLILGEKAGGGSVELIQASVFCSGVAVLSETMSSAIVELFDDHDDPLYVDEAYLAARKILPVGFPGSSPPSASKGVLFGSARSLPSPSNYALVTPLPTAAHASSNQYHYCALAVLPRIHTSSQHPELFLSTSDNSVIIVDSSTAQMTDVDCRARIASPIVSMSFAPNGRFLACFTKASILTVISTSFETKVLDFDTSPGSSSPPRDMKWCGEDSVVLHWKNLGVLMVGPYGDWLRFPFENTNNLHIVSEIDCCRIVTDNAVEILQRVPPATALLLRIGSIEPSALLLDASDAFQAGSPSSDEAARAITKTGLLNDAIETCADAASREFDLPTQKRLLTAASYGMHFTYKDTSDGRYLLGGPTQLPRDDHFSPDTRPSPTALVFVDTARKIRILNGLRHPDVGFPLTSSQFDALTPSGLVARLVNIRRPALASSIATYLSLPKSVRSYAQSARASAFVQTDIHRTDAQTAESAIQILQESRDVKENPSFANWGGYAVVALAAHKAGRTGVANILLMLEPCVKDKVWALINIGSYADAAAVAANAKDTDLIFQALVEYEQSCLSTTPDPDKAHQLFINTVVTKFPPEAYNLLKTYYSSKTDIKSALTLLIRAQNYTDAGSFLVKRAVKLDSDIEKLSMMKEASRIFGLGKESTFHKSCTDDYLELIAEQERLRTTYRSPEIAPPSSSIASTLSSIIQFAAKTNDPRIFFSEADKLAKKFRLTEKRLWHIKIRALAASKQWTQLRILAESRAKPPTGFKPFASVAVRFEQPVREIVMYVDKVPSQEERYELYCEAKMWSKALDEAYKMKDIGKIHHVYTDCNSPEIKAYCDQLAEQLSKS